ncbi:XdhC family protein [Chloroflexota bacterium]
MRELLNEVGSWLESGERVGLATVIRVLGSAPRPVGAKMIVSSGGRMAGSVSGGCVETTVFEELQAVLNGQPAHTVEFGITEDMIWDVGLACGGTIEVFLQEIDAPWVAAVDDYLERGVAFALVTVVAGEERAGSRALVGREGVELGDLDGQAKRAAQEMLAARSASGALSELDSGEQVFIEPFLVPPHLVIVGGVHVAIPLTRFAKELGFSVTVIDPRAKFANRERFPDADEVVREWPDDALEQIDVDDGSYVVLLTHDPKIDEPTLAAALKTEARYIGAIGSRNTHAQRFQRMAKWGVTPEQLERLYAPIGLDLGGKTPGETALSIIAEVVAVKNRRSGASLRRTRGRIGVESDSP